MSTREAILDVLRQEGLCATGRIHHLIGKGVSQRTVEKTLNNLHRVEGLVIRGDTWGGLHLWRLKGEDDEAPKKLAFMCMSTSDENWTRLSATPLFGPSIACSETH